MEYEAVIGLEVHVQIKAESKIFSRCRAGYGHEPNTLVDPVVAAISPSTTFMVVDFPDPFGPTMVTISPA